MRGGFGVRTSAATIRWIAYGGGQAHAFEPRGTRSLCRAVGRLEPRWERPQDLRCEACVSIADEREVVPEGEARALWGLR